MSAPSANSQPPILLDARNVKKTYRLGRVDVPVLHDASLAVHDGEWVAILGASGSGKSTLLHILGGLDSPDRESGPIRFRDVDVSSLRRDTLNHYRNRSIGFVFQFYHLLPELTVLENALLAGLVPKTITRALRPLLALLLGLLVGALLGWCIGPGVLPDADELTSARHSVLIATWAVVGAAVGVGLFQLLQIPLEKAAIHRGPTASATLAVLDDFGLSHRLRHRPSQLSGGERQRTAIARALANSPDVLLADEPTGNLDMSTGREILDLLKNRHDDGLTIVMVTHDSAVAAYADRVVHLVDGRMTEVPS